jgi:hypothetical protein
MTGLDASPATALPAINEQPSRKESEETGKKGGAIAAVHFQPPRPPRASSSGEEWVRQKDKGAASDSNVRNPNQSAFLHFAGEKKPACWPPAFRTTRYSGKRKNLVKQASNTFLEKLFFTKIRGDMSPRRLAQRPKKSRVRACQEGAAKKSPEDFPPFRRLDNRLATRSEEIPAHARRVRPSLARAAIIDYPRLQRHAARCPFGVSVSKPLCHWQRAIVFCARGSPACRERTACRTVFFGAGSPCPN